MTLSIYGKINPIDIQHNTMPKKDGNSKPIVTNLKAKNMVMRPKPKCVDLKTKTKKINVDNLLSILWNPFFKTFALKHWCHWQGDKEQEVEIQYQDRWRNSQHMLEHWSAAFCKTQRRDGGKCLHTKIYIFIIFISAHLLTLCTNEVLQQYIVWCWHLKWHERWEGRIQSASKICKIFKFVLRRHEKSSRETWSLILFNECKLLKSALFNHFWQICMSVIHI